MRTWPRIPTQYSQHRAASGRLSSGVDTSDPDKGIKGRKVQQMQNMPKRLRDMFVPDDGMIMVGADWSNIEWLAFMVFAARLNQPPGFHKALIERFCAGELDAHRYLASVFYGVPESEVTEAMRKTVKPFTHGLDYYGAPTTIGRLQGTPDEVSGRVAVAHERAFRVSPVQQHLISLAKQQKFIETSWGWRVWFFDWEPKPTEILGIRTQAECADLCKKALVQLFHDMKRRPRWEVLTTTHDSIVAQVPIVDRDEAGDYLQTLMSQPVPEWGGIRPVVKVSSGYSWAEAS